jgi:hypothetical protein
VVSVGARNGDGFSAWTCDIRAIRKTRDNSSMIEVIFICSEKLIFDKTLVEWKKTALFTVFGTL